MRFLLDTCVISEETAKRRDKKVLDWIDHLDPYDLYLSAVTMGEIRKGISLNQDPSRRAGLEAWLGRELGSRFAGRVLSFDAEVAETWGELVARRQLARRTMPVIDSLIAATALHHGMTLVTRNEDDFADTGVVLVNPWRPA